MSNNRMLPGLTVTIENPYRHWVPSESERDAIETAVNHIRLAHKLCGSVTMELDFELPSGEFPAEVELRMSGRWPDRDTGSPVGVVQMRTLPAMRLGGMSMYEARDTLALWVRECLLGFLAHEVDEMLLVEGIRYKDPHETP